MYTNINIFGEQESFNYIVEYQKKNFGYISNLEYMMEDQTENIYFCTDNNTGQTIPKDYTIKIVLDADANKQIKWVDRIENPLGLRVKEYTIVEGDGDPLSTGFRTAEQI